MCLLCVFYNKYLLWLFFYRSYLKKYNKYFFMGVFYGCYIHLNLVVCFSNNGHFGLQQ